MMTTSSSEVANPVTHSALDFFEKPSVLISYDNAFDQQIFPHTANYNAPILEFVIEADNRNCIDLNAIFLYIEAGIFLEDGKKRATVADNDVLFVNNILHSLFRNCEVLLNGTSISNANGYYAHKAFLETEFTLGSDSKATWVFCAGYSLEETPGDFTQPVFQQRLKTGLAGGNMCLYGPLCVDFFNSEKLLIPDTSLRIKLTRNREDFCLINKDGEKYMVGIEKANIFARKISLTDQVKLSVERALLKSPCRYSYIETVQKTFIIPAGQNSFTKEDIFSRMPIRRLTLAMATNQQFSGTGDTNPFHYQKFGLSRVAVMRNGIPIGGTPLDTNVNVRAYFNSLWALGYRQGGHGVPLQHYSNHFVLVFDLTATQEASQQLMIFPELTNASILLQLHFQDNLTDTVELFVMGERFSVVYVDSDRKAYKNTLFHG